MRIPELKDYLKTIPVTRSVLIVGPPGVGKSVATREFAENEAKKMGLEFVDYDDSMFSEIVSSPDSYYVYVDMRLTEVEPSDLIGIPRDLDSTVSYKPLTWATVLSKAKRGLLFLDELTNISRPDIISVAYKIILDRKAGFTKISNGVRIIAAGNTPEQSSVANLLPTPLISRFHIINVDAPTLNEWAEWMDINESNWDKRGLAYLMRFPDDFLKLPPEPETLDSYPCPRTWHWLLAELPNTPKEYVRDKVLGYIGPEVGQRFYAFLNNPIPDIKELLEKPEIFKTLSLDSKYLSVVSVANYYVNTLKNPAKLVGFLKVVADVQEDFVILFTVVAKKKLAELLKYITSSPELSNVWKILRDVGAYMAGL
ncbi:MAG: ATP-binding protein [Nitrososphaerota archaeon]